MPASASQRVGSGDRGSPMELELFPAGSARAIRDSVLPGQSDLIIIGPARISATRSA